MQGGPARRGGVSAEWTQELQATDVLEVIEPGARPRASSSSIAPVGLDLAPTRGVDGEISPTMEIRLPRRRRRLRAIVAAAVAGCGVILVAAGVARIVHGGAASTSSASAPPMTPAQPSAGTRSVAAMPPTDAPTTGDVPTTGTLRLERPARPGHVWLDGRKLSSSLALVTCGAHVIQVGRHRAHAVDVPCGGEIALSR
jgi:hypothetical protein